MLPLDDHVITDRIAFVICQCLEIDLPFTISRSQSALFQNDHRGTPQAIRMLRHDLVDVIGEANRYANDEHNKVKETEAVATRTRLAR